MIGDIEKVRLFNALLAGELGAISQYMVHAEQDDLWKHDRLHQIVQRRAAIVAQPARLDDTARTRVQRIQRLAQAVAVQFVTSARFQTLPMSSLTSGAGKSSAAMSCWTR